MSKQPLTNTNLEIVVLGPNLEAIDFALQQYNFPSDPLDVTPTLTVIKITSYAGLFEHIYDHAPDTRPCTAVAGTPDKWLTDARAAFVGGVVTMDKALAMVNNEYAIRRDQIINGTVKQTPKRIDY